MAESNLGPVLVMLLASLYLVLRCLEGRLFRAKVIPRPSLEPAGPPKTVRPFTLGHLDDPSLEADELVDLLELAARLQDTEQIPLVARLLDHPDLEVRLAAANTLGQMGDERALPYLLESASRLEVELGRVPSADSADPAAAALAGAGDADAAESGPPPGLLTAPDAVRPTAPGSWTLDDLLWPDGEGPGPLLARLPAREFEREDVARALVELALEDEAPERLRYFALKNLEIFPAPEWERPICGLLSDPTPALRYGAVCALGALGPSPRGLECLEASSRDEHRQVRLEALRTLCRLAPVRARRLLLGRLDDPDPLVRELARHETGRGPASREPIANDRDPVHVWDQAARPATRGG